VGVLSTLIDGGQQWIIKGHNMISDGSDVAFRNNGFVDVNDLEAMRGICDQYVLVSSECWRR